MPERRVKRMFGFLKKRKKEANEQMATTDEREISKAKEEIAERGKDSQTTRDRTDEIVAEREKESGNENSQTAKDRIDESDGTKKADEKREEEKEEKREERHENSQEDRLDKLASALEKLVSILTPKETEKPKNAFDEKYGMKTKEPPMAERKEYGEKEINALLGR